MRAAVVGLGPRLATSLDVLHGNHDPRAVLDGQPRTPVTRSLGREGRVERRRRSSEVTLPVPSIMAEPDAPVRVDRRSAELRPSAAHLVRWNDAAIEHEIIRLLHEQLDPACHVEVRVSEGGVVLRGGVSCPLARMLAEDLAYSVQGVRECLNSLEVVHRDPRSVARATRRTLPSAR